MNDFDLSDIPESTLISELEKRNKQKEYDERQRGLKQFQKIIDNKDVLTLFMQHDRSSCEDGHHTNCNFHPEHGGADCNLCIMRTLSISDFDFVDVSIDIRVSRKGDK